MLGYVNIAKKALSEEDYNVYKAYYCGVCKSIGERYGQIPRMALSYDAVFLAMVLASLEDTPDALVKEHCIIHPIKTVPVSKGDPAVDYAADMLLALAYYNFIDDIEDEHKLRGNAGKLALKGAHTKINRRYPKVLGSIKESLADLTDLERRAASGDAEVAPLDILTEAFGKILAAVFTGFRDSDRENRILHSIGMNLGKWIYLMDAIDDYEKDTKSGAFNPLIYRERGLDGLDALLYNYLGEVSSAIDLLDIRKNKGIIDNVIWFGLRARSEQILGEEEK